MRSGIYILTRDLDNPRGDGRCSGYWRRKKWKAGDKFVVRPWPEDPRHTIISVFGHCGEWLGFTGNQDILRLLLPALSPAPMNLDNVLELHGVSADTLLRRLMKSGRVTMEDVQRHVHTHGQEAQC